MVFILFFSLCTSFQLYYLKVPHITVFGMAGHGKSAFINALCGGRNISHESSSEEGTFIKQSFDCGGFIIHDTPGFGTRQFPVKHHFKRYKTSVDHLNILIVTNRLYGYHYDFVNDYTGFTDLIVVRTQIDIFPPNKNSKEFIIRELFNVPKDVLFVSNTWEKAKIVREFINRYQ